MSDIHEKLADIASYLFARWQHESEYEYFSQYVNHMQAQMPEGATITKMTKRPFRIEYTMQNGEKRWIAISSRQVQWGGYAPKVLTEAV